MSQDAAPQRLLDLPIDLLRHCVSLALPARGFAAAAVCWKDALAAATASAMLHEALGDALHEAFDGLAPLVPAQVLDAFWMRRTCWMRLVRSLNVVDDARWRTPRLVRAVRAQKPNRAPVHSPPRLSGASLCAVREGQLVLFGGRDSASGESNASQSRSQRRLLPRISLCLSAGRVL
eukprot:6245300-Prymnesium_polylepis.3